MNTKTQLSLWIEVIKVVLPIVATVIVGILVARSAEKHKNQLSKQLFRYQTVHPRKVEVLEGAMNCIVDSARQLRSGVDIMRDDWFYRGSLDRQAIDLKPIVNSVHGSLQLLDENLERNQLYLDDDIRNLLKLIVADLRSAISLFTVHYDEESDISHTPIFYVDEFGRAEDLIEKKIPTQIEELRKKIRNQFLSEGEGEMEL